MVRVSQVQVRNRVVADGRVVDVAGVRIVIARVLVRAVVDIVRVVLACA